MVEMINGLVPYDESDTGLNVYMGMGFFYLMIETLT